MKKHEKEKLNRLNAHTDELDQVIEQLEKLEGAPSAFESVERLQEALSQAKETSAKTYVNTGMRVYSKESVESAEAIQFFEKQAKLGDPLAMYQLGIRLAEGGKSPAKGVKWLKRAIENGINKALWPYAVMMEEGTAGKKDLEEAVRCYELLAKEDHLSAIERLSRIYSGEDSKLRNDEKSLKYHHRLAEAGDFDSNVFLSRHYKDRGDFGKALPHMLEANKVDSELYLRELGDIYYHGQGTQRNVAQAFKFYSPLAKGGDQELQHLMAKHYETGDGIPKNFAKAVEWYDRHWKTLDASTLAAVAGYYAQGRIEAKTPVKKAIMWYERAYRKGDRSNLKYLIEHVVSDVKRQTYQKAFAEAGDLASIKTLASSSNENRSKWVELAADQGDVESRIESGIHHFMEKNYEMAWSRLGSLENLENTDAMLAVGMCLRDGLGTEVDSERALQVFLKAADLGESTAAYVAGYMFDEGLGTERDPQRAAKLFEQAYRANVRTDELGPKLFWLYHNQEDFEKAEPYLESLKEQEGYLSGELFTFYGDRARNERPGIAARFFEIAYERGEENTAIRLGQVYLGLQNVDKAYHWIEIAANEGDPVALNCMGDYYRYGINTRKSLNKAKDFYERAVESGSQEAVKQLSEVTEEIELNRKVREERKKREEANRAERERLDALKREQEARWARERRERERELEQQRREREQEEQRLREIREEERRKKELIEGPYFLKNAKGGDPYYMNKVGDWYEERGDKKTAIRWYKRAARKGNYSAISNLSYHGIKYNEKWSPWQMGWYEKLAPILVLVILGICLWLPHLSVLDGVFFALLLPILSGLLLWAIFERTDGVRSTYRLASIAMMVSALLFIPSIFDWWGFGFDTMTLALGGLWTGITKVGGFFAMIGRGIWAGVKFVGYIFEFFWEVLKTIGWAFATVFTHLWTAVKFVVSSLWHAVTFIVGIFWAAITGLIDGFRG